MKRPTQHQRQPIVHIAHAAIARPCHDSGDEFEAAWPQAADSLQVSRCGCCRRAAAEAGPAPMPARRPETAASSNTSPRQAGRSSWQSFKLTHQYFGPLDLLLHIVRREELVLSDLPLAKITNQYLEYLEVLVELSIDDVADFIEIASILVEMKAKQAVPDQRDPAEADSGGGGGR
ncbi:MAG: segregation/condensation protein A [Pirellulaceae bacterium]